MINKCISKAILFITLIIFVQYASAFSLSEWFQSWNHGSGHQSRGQHASHAKKYSKKSYKKKSKGDYLTKKKTGDSEASKQVAADTQTNALSTTATGNATTNTTNTTNQPVTTQTVTTTTPTGPTPTNTPPTSTTTTSDANKMTTPAAGNTNTNPAPNTGTGNTNGNSQPTTKPNDKNLSQMDFGPGPFKNTSHVKGIYLTQYTLENTAMLNYLIKHAKAAGIDTFIVDLELIPSKKYEQNIALVRQNGIKYVARIIMFPDGGTPEQIHNPTFWQRKFALVKQAVAWGASQIQLDYIRFNTKQRPSPENAKQIFAIIEWYNNQLKSLGHNTPLQVDVFGITSFGESKYIGQNIQLFSKSVDAICPMVYPSHYVPFPEHFRKPYETVYNSLTHIKKQFGNPMPMKVYAYIELSNYHYPMSREKTLEYIKAQIKAVEAAGADGWYAWSPHNRYDNLFSILEGKPIKAD